MRKLQPTLQPHLASCSGENNGLVQLSMLPVVPISLVPPPMLLPMRTWVKLTLMLLPGCVLNGFPHMNTSDRQPLMMPALPLRKAVPVVTPKLWEVLLPRSASRRRVMN